MCRLTKCSIRSIALPGDGISSLRCNCSRGLRRASHWALQTQSCVALPQSGCTPAIYGLPVASRYSPQTPRTLIIELFAAGFRWTGRPQVADRGLWHPELQIAIDVIDPVPRGLAQESNTLTVALDLGVTATADQELVSLKVVGIEDLIVEEAACMWRHGAPSGEAAARAYVAGRARAGKG